MLLKNKIFRIVFGIAVPLLAAASVFWAVLVKLPLPCLFYISTGLYCPSCGATRAIIAIFDGDILRALRCNAFVTVLLLPGAFMLIRIYLGVIMRRRDYLMIKHAHGTIVTVIVFAGLFVLYGIVRNIPTVPFTFLTPY